MSNLPLGAEFDDSAPWLDNNARICYKCGESMEEFDSGTTKRIKWINWICLECGNTYNEEPDYDY